MVPGVGGHAVFAEQVQLFEAHGIRLVHPVRGAAVVLDVEGDQVLMRPEELGHLLGLRISSITMQWWFSADIDVVHSYSYDPLGCEIQTLWLDGLTRDQADTVETAVVAAATGLPTPTRAVIVDRRGKVTLMTGTRSCSTRGRDCRSSGTGCWCANRSRTGS